MATYEICGTCSISCSGNKIEIWLFPANGYLSPCGDFAVFYPVGKSSKALLKKGKKVCNNDKHRWIKLFIKNASAISTLIPLVAETQRKVKLTIKKNHHKLKVVKCLFPAP